MVHNADTFLRSLSNEYPTTFTLRTLHINCETNESLVQNYKMYHRTSPANQTNQVNIQLQRQISLKFYLRLHKYRNELLTSRVQSKLYCRHPCYINNTSKSPFASCRQKVTNNWLSCVPASFVKFDAVASHNAGRVRFRRRKWMNAPGHARSWPSS